MVRTLEIPTSAGPDAGLPAPVVLTDEERAALLDLARSAVTVAARAAPESVIRAALERHSPLERRAAAFVTLTGTRVRPRVGHMDAQARGRSVIEAANWAALGDPRFPRVRALRAPPRVSVLGPFVRQEDLAGWRLGCGSSW
jgi:AMMECR1 domain-containing protein